MPWTADATRRVYMDNAMESTMDYATDHAMDDHSSMDCTMVPSMDKR